MTERTGTLWRQVGMLLVAALVIQALLVALTLLYVNMPPGFNVPYGLNPASVSLFRTLWAYPVISLSGTQFRRLAALTIGLLWGAYLAAVFVIWRRPSADGQRRRALFILLMACVFNIELALFLPPVLSVDVHLYALFGRMVAIHHLNPYVVPCAAVQNDPFWPSTVWRGTTQYGPLWTLMSAAIALPGGDSMLRTVLLFKVVAALFNVGGGVLVYLLARRLAKDTVLPLLLYAWNPLILIESAGSAHNDVVMIAIALAGVLLVLEGRILGGVAALVASVMVKYITMLLLFFCVLHCVSRQRSWRRAASLAVRTAMASLAVVAVSYFPFLSGITRTDQLIAGLGLGVTPSLNPMPNPVRLFLHAGVADILSVVNSPSLAVIPTEAWATLLLNLGFVLLLVVLGRTVMAARSGAAEIFTCFGLASLVYVYVVYGNSFPWPLLTPLTASTVGPPTRGNCGLQLCCIGLGVVFMASYA